MASYHLSVKVISRSAGRSATAAAAYRSGEKIVCDREGRIHDYTRRKGVDHTEIIVPSGAGPIQRETLWNAAEAAERRKNSCVAREFEIALPVELSGDQRKHLAVYFAHEIADRHGCAVDVAIHKPARGDDRNHHAHLLTTTRVLGADGLGAKCRELDDQKTGPKEVEHWRARWAELQNEALARAGVEVHVSHLKLSQQGLATERLPTIHLGPAASEMERRGVVSERGDYNRSVMIRNQQRQSLAQLIDEAEGQIRVGPVPNAGDDRGDRSAGRSIETSPVDLAAELRRLADARQARLIRIEQLARAREDRRIDALKNQVRKEPAPPRALSAAFRQGQYLQDHAGWQGVALQLETLAKQARALRRQVTEALQHVQQWAIARLRREHSVAVVQAEQAEAAEQLRQRQAGEMARSARALAEHLLKGRAPEPTTSPALIKAAILYQKGLQVQKQTSMVPDQVQKELARHLANEAAGRLPIEQTGQGQPAHTRPMVNVPDSLLAKYAEYRRHQPAPVLKKQAAQQFFAEPDIASPKTETPKQQLNQASGHDLDIDR